MDKAIYISPKNGRVFIGRFGSGDDLLGSLTGFCKKENIRLGVFSLIGAVKCAQARLL